LEIVKVKKISRRVCTVFHGENKDKGKSKNQSEKVKSTVKSETLDKRNWNHAAALFKF